MSKPVKRYQILICDFPRHSTPLGRGKLIRYHRACRVIKRLKKAGIDCYKSPVQV